MAILIANRKNQRRGRRAVDNLLAPDHLGHVDVDVDPGIPPRFSAGQNVKSLVFTFRAHRTGPAVEARFQFLTWLVPAVEKFEKDWATCWGRV